MNYNKHNDLNGWHLRMSTVFRMLWLGMIQPGPGLFARARYGAALALMLLATLPALALAAPTLQVSYLPDRSASFALNGSEVAGDLYIHASPASGVKRVRFYLDAPPPAGAWKTENLAPYDFNGTAGNGNGNAFDSTQLADGQHAVYAEVTYTDNSLETLSAAFTVNNANPSLTFSDSSASFTTLESDNSTQTTSVTVDATSAFADTVFLSDDASWLTVDPTSGTVPLSVTLTMDPAGLAPGNYTATVTATGSGANSGSMQVQLEVIPDQPSQFELMLSPSPDRSNPMALNGATVVGDIYVFVPDLGNVSQVRFYLDNPQATGTPTQTENLAPYDLAGGSSTQAQPFDTTTLADGSHTLTAEVVTTDNGTHVLSDFFSVANDTPTLSFSQGSLADSRHVDNATVAEHTVQLTSSDGSSPTFTLSSDAPWLSATGDSGTTPATITVIADPAGLAAGTYNGTVTAEAAGLNPASLAFTFTITEGNHGILVAPTSLTFTGAPDAAIASQTLDVSHSQSSSEPFTVSTNMPWLSATPTSGTTPELVEVSVDSSGQASGSYSAILTITPASGSSVDVPVTMSLSSSGKCAPVQCSDVRVDLPYQLTFTEGQGYFADKNGWGTGFTWLDKPSNGSGYIPGNLEMKFLEGVLEFTTTEGIQYRTENDLDNALGVGFAAPNQITLITAQMLDVPIGTGNYEQAGLWFGNDEDHYIKLVVMSTPRGLILHYLMELGGVTEATKNIRVDGLTDADITLFMEVNPYQRNVDLGYKIEDGSAIQVGTLSPPDEFFSFDAAGIDPEIGTRSFTGIFATHRKAPQPAVYRFDEFTLQVGGTTLSPNSVVDFIRRNYNVSFPTSMVWGPDDRLYVTELFGTIHALTFDTNMNVVDDEVIDTLVNSVGNRLTLGITVSPFSTASNVELWVAHSSPSVNNGEANSGMVTTLGGAGFADVNHVITGLPRAIANHSINSIHFGPDDNQLYIAMGGNTGAGAPNNSNSEFGDRAEQPLSAAILVANVFSPSFDGSCANTSDIYGPPPCDVVTYATGLRNSYDFVFHTNGNMYATDNGLGVTGTYPPTPQPQCLGFGDTASYLDGGHNPGTQPDLLLLIEQDHYYGHPNPYRDECVFKDGSYQQAAPLPNYVPPLFNLGDHKSSNAIVEFKGGTGCVGEYLNGQLLITNYSVGDDVFRVELGQAGTVAVDGSPLITGFNDPLPMTVGPGGTLFVGEFGGNKLTTLVPVSLGCWSTVANTPVPLLDASGAAIGDRVYAVGGKNNTGHLNSLWIYDTGTDSWSQGADLPGVGVENPAVVAHNGQLYVFGGSTGPFSGAVTNAAVYSPGSNSWTSLPPMAVGRSGPTAQVINGQIYVVGGMDDNGASLASVEVYDPGSQSWSGVAPMQTRRDNPGSAAVDGKLYVFGGRTRDAGGATADPTLTSVEIFNPGTGNWSAGAPMPTGRRAMSVGTLDNKVQVIGGEQDPNAASGVFEEAEEYDPATNSWRSLTKSPAPKHGAATATLGDRLYIVGGGISSGTSFSQTVEVMQY